MTKRSVRGEEGNKRSLGVEAESVVGEVDGFEFRKGEERLEDMIKCLGDLGEQARGEDVGKVGDLVSKC